MRLASYLGYRCGGKQVIVNKRCAGRSLDNRINDDNGKLRKD